MRPKLFALIAVPALALAGCAATDSPDNAAITSSPSPAASPTSESEVEPKALSIEPAPTYAAKGDLVEAQKNKTYEEQTSDFRAFINPEFSGWMGELPPESELLAAAKLVCEQLRSGKPYDEIEAIKGSLNDSSLSFNNQKLVNAASSAFCLEERS